MNVLWETMIAEMRAERAEADQRRHFTKENDTIELVRGLVDDMTATEEPIDVELVATRTAGAMRMAAESDLFELG